ncbi:hypothetical protein M885DRAFT_265388 [Pelagophyceae sp. CCMP2097]|nr:hypothetical protein M885DRAFT_265388 [Pelagophyceae sp. CCMP2097]
MNASREAMRLESSSSVSAPAFRGSFPTVAASASLPCGALRSSCETAAAPPGSSSSESPTARGGTRAGPLRAMSMDMPRAASKISLVGSADWAAWSSPEIFVEPSKFSHDSQAQLMPQRTCASKHSQYFFKQRDLRKVCRATVKKSVVRRSKSPSFEC